MSARRGGGDAGDRVRNEAARNRYYTGFRCKGCGAPPSIFHDEFQADGPLCTPCRRDRVVALAAPADEVLP